MFKLYNKCYFDDRIPQPHSIQFSNLDIHKACGMTKAGSIYIDSGLKKYPRLAEIILIHEAVHLMLGSEYHTSHGMRFQAELVRLWNEGAYDGVL